jgi:hypothetical protein
MAQWVGCINGFSFIAVASFTPRGRDGKCGRARREEVVIAI